MTAFTKAIAAFCCIFIIGCNGPIFDKRISEGVIEYAVDYPSMDENNVLSEFLPDKMVMSFSDNRFSNELTAGMGMFRTSFIVNSNNHSMIHAVKLINKRFYTELDTAAVRKFNEKKPVPYILDLNETDTVAGYACHRAVAIFANVHQSPIYLLYTDDIRLKDPNWSNIFSTIPGVLLEYQITENGITMHFKANSVIRVTVDDGVFSIDPEFEKISNEEMEHQMNDIFETFNY